MNVVRFVNGCAQKTEKNIIYFIPIWKNKDNKRSLDLSILEVVDITETQHTGRKFYEGYKASISDDMLNDWQKQLSTANEGVLDIFDMLKKALQHYDDFGLTLTTSTEKQPAIEFWKTNLNNSVSSIGQVNLETIEIVPSAGRLLETIVLNLQETAEVNSQLQQSVQGKMAKQDELEKGLMDLTRSKFRMEDRLYRAFTKVLNQKKKRIIELERRIRLLEEQNHTLTPNSTSKLKVPRRPTRRDQVTVPSSSEEDERIEQSSPEFERETDVQDSDTGAVINQTLKSTKRKLKHSSSSSGDRPTCSRKLFPLEPDKPASEHDGSITVKYSPKDSKKTKQALGDGKCVEDSETDFTESSQELFVPKYCKTKKSKKNNIRHRILEKNLKPLSKKCGLAKNGPNDVEIMVDDPNHILNQMFGST